MIQNLHYGIERLQDPQYGDNQTDDTVSESEMVKLYWQYRHDETHNATYKANYLQCKCRLLLKFYEFLECLSQFHFNNFLLT